VSTKNATSFISWTLRKKVLIYSPYYYI
jgi:hypothetical protein